MEVLDYDFHLFRDRASGENSLVWRSDDGGYALARLHASEVPIEPTDAPIDVARADAPTLTLAAALERVDSGPERFVLFADAETGRGNVAYRRFEGHYGLITPSRGIAPSWRVTGGLGVHPSIGPIRSTARTPTP